ARDGTAREGARSRFHRGIDKNSCSARAANQSGGSRVRCASNTEINRLRIADLTRKRLRVRLSASMQPSYVEFFGLPIAFLVVLMVLSFRGGLRPALEGAAFFAL